MIQNTLKQTHLNHIFGKEGGSMDTGRSGLAALCWPLAGCSPRHGLMTAAGKLLCGKNFTFSTNIIETKKSS